jgi:aryl-alcohol dehydrogenase-like predicted oxidoreductase
METRRLGGIALVPYSPRFTGENFRRNPARGDRVRQLAEAKGCTPAQLALAWLLARSPVMVPIPGTTSVEHLEENVASAGIRLSAEEVAMLAAAPA